MTNAEHFPFRFPGEPHEPPPLPPELAAFLQDKEYICLPHATERHGTVYIVKLPGKEIRSVQGRVPIQLRHELYDHPRSPVIRSVTAIYDQPQTPLALESFVNVGDTQQRQDFAALSQQA